MTEAPGTRADQMCLMLGDEDSVPEDIHRKYRTYYDAAVEEELRTGVPTIVHFRRLAWSSHGGGSVPFAVQLLVAAGATVKGGTWEPQHVETLQSVMAQLSREGPLVGAYLTAQRTRPQA